MSAHGIKLRVSEGSVGGTLVVLSGGDTGVSVPDQENVIRNGKEPVEVRGGGAGAATIMEFFSMEGYSTGFLIGVAIVAARLLIGDEKGLGSILSGGSFEDFCDGNLESVRHVDGNPMGLS